MNKYELQAYSILNTYYSHCTEILCIIELRAFGLTCMAYYTDKHNTHKRRRQGNMGFRAYNLLNAVQHT